MATREETLRTFRGFTALDPDVLADLARASVVRTFRAGDAIWHAGERAERFVLIQSGLVKIVRRAANGAEAIVGLFGPRESIGDTAVLARETYPADALVITDAASVLSVDASPVLATIAERASVARAMNQMLLEHTKALQEKIAVMSAGNVPQRLAAFFLLLAGRFGDEMESGVLRVPVHLSRQEISRMVGATVETVIRTLSRWQKTKLIATDAEGFELLDPASLERIARGER